jgi:8-oxo-dGTP pyrophosphatase MutT (NUDIX family)
MISSRTNDNYDDFPASEIKKAYKTFIGKPVFVNHHNDDHRRARGVIIDAAIHEDTNPDGTPDTWVEGLMMVDAIRFPILAKAILAGHIDRTSMGTDVAYSVCTACGNKAYTPIDYCAHIPKMKGQRIYRTTASGQKVGVLVAETCYGLKFFENSLLVEDPADPTALVLGVTSSDNMTPRLSSLNLSNKNRTDIELRCDVPISELPFSVSSLTGGGLGQKLSNLADVIGCELGLRIEHPAQATVTFDHIGRILRVSTQNPMSGIMTQLYVASMSDDETFRDDSNQIGISPSMGTNTRSLIIGEGESSISRVEGSSNPEPTFGRIIGGSDLGEIPLHFSHEIETSRKKQGSANQDSDEPTVAGVAVKAKDTGRLLMLQRSINDESDPAAGMWEMPGGHAEDGENLFNAGVREWQEETGHVFPVGDPGGVWDSPNGIYRGFLWIVPSEDSVPIHDTNEKVHINPDDPDGDDTEALAWWDPEHLPFNPSVREEVRKGSDWDLLGASKPKKATIKVKSSAKPKIVYVSLPHENPAKAHEILTRAHRKHVTSKDADLDPGIINKLRSDGGFSVNIDTQQEPHDGYMVSIGTGQKYSGIASLTPERMQQFVDQHHSILSNPSHFLGAWLDTDTGDVWLDVSERLSSEQAALARAKELGELAIFDVKNGRSIYVDKTASLHVAETEEEKRKRQAHSQAQSNGHSMSWRRGGYGFMGICGNCGSECHTSPTTTTGSATNTPCPAPSTTTTAKIMGISTEAAPRYSDPADHPWFQANPVDHNNIIDHFDRATPQDLDQGGSWYSGAHAATKLFAQASGLSNNQVAGLIANYSPNTAWPTNLLNTASAIDKGEGVGGEGSGFFATDRQRQNANKIMAGSDYKDILKGPKIRDFAHLIEHGGDEDPSQTHAVIDRHAMSVATGRRLTDDELDSAPISTPHYYNHVVAQYKKAAEVLSEREGRAISPHQVQATTWLVRQRENALADAAHVGNLEKGRTTRNLNAGAKWNDYAQERYPTLVTPGWHSGSLNKEAYGETIAPADVDTLRDEGCPVCGEDDSFNGAECVVCGYVAPPKQFQDPDVSAAQENDIRQDTQDQIDGGTIPTVPAPGKKPTVIVETGRARSVTGPAVVTKQKTSKRIIRIHSRVK